MKKNVRFDDNFLAPLICIDKKKLSHYDKFIKDLQFFFFQATKYANKLEKMYIPLEKYLKEGVLSEEFVLDNIPKMMNVMRDSNVTLRWLMLHTSALSPSKLTLIEIVTSHLDGSCFIYQHYLQVSQHWYFNVKIIW